MRIVKLLFATVAALIGVLAVAGFLLPGKLEVERSASIAATPEQVYGYVGGFGRFNEWSPWADLDPDARYTYSGPASGPGARMQWQSELPRVGAGSQEVVAAIPPREVTTRLVFDGRHQAHSTMRLEAAGAGTRVTWLFDMELGLNPLDRWIGLLADRSVGADYVRGLGRLKALVETEVAQAREAAALEAAAEDVPDPGAH